jgi:hypothetical protein
VLLSRSIDVFEGARAAVLDAEGMFRLDVLIVPDSLRILVRNLCGAELSFEPSGYPRPVVVQGDLGELALRPGHHEMTFRLGGPQAEGAVQADVTIATLRMAEQGIVRVTAQAFVHKAA